MMVKKGQRSRGLSKSYIGMFHTMSAIALFMVFLASPCSAGCSTESGTVTLSTEAAVQIKEKVYSRLAVAVANLNFLAVATKYVSSLRNPPSDINLDVDTNHTSNPIQSLIYNLYQASGSSTDIFICYKNEQYMKYEGKGNKDFTWYHPKNDGTQYAGRTVTYSFNKDDGSAFLNSPPLDIVDDYNCTSRPWYVMGSRCPSDSNLKFDCSLAWTEPYLDFTEGNMIVTANLGIPRYSGPETLPPDVGGLFSNGKAIEDVLLGVVASDFSLDEIDAILQTAMSKTDPEPTDVSYIMTENGKLLSVSDGSEKFICDRYSSETNECIDATVIFANRSSSSRIQASATYLATNNVKSDNTLLMEFHGTPLVVTVRGFREWGLLWYIVTVSAHNEDKSCILEVEQAKLRQAIFGVDVLLNKAVAAGDLIRNALTAPGGALANDGSDRYKIPAWEDLNSDRTLSMQNLLKGVAEIYPILDTVSVGYNDQSHILYDFKGEKFDFFRYQNPRDLTNTSNKSYNDYYYTHPVTGYVYSDLGKYRYIDYDCTDRPWYKLAQSLGKASFVQPYLYEDFNIIGTTYSVPFYNEENNLAGVIGIDLTLGLIDEKLAEFTNPGSVIYVMETKLSGVDSGSDDREYNMVASSSYAEVQYNANGDMRQAKAYAEVEVEDFFVYHSAKYMLDNNIETDTTFRVENFTCNVLKYDTDTGISWRFVEVTYDYNGIAQGTTDGGGDSTTEFYSSGSHVSESVLILVSVMFAVLIMIAIGLCMVVHRQNNMIKIIQRRRVPIPKSLMMQMTGNPLQGEVGGDIDTGATTSNPVVGNAAA